MAEAAERLDPVPELKITVLGCGGAGGGAHRFARVGRV